MADEFKRIREASIEQGWRWDRTNNGHWKGLAPDGKTIVVHSGTPSDHRGLRNALSRMRRVGFRW